MTTKKNALSLATPGVLLPCRLPVASQTLAQIGLDPGTWAVLTDSIFPGARTPEGVLLAVRYCQARGLDVMKRPVHVVPMWSKALNREVETVWPGIAEVQTTAARTGCWAGLDSPRFGPEVTRTFRGAVKRDGRWEEVEVTLTYPQWAEVIVYRLVNGVRCPFSETVFWEETYARAGRSELPNEMWQKRPRGQLLKCAKAASLRAAFPEEAGYTAEEMAGRPIDPDEVAAPPVIDADAAIQASLPAKPVGESDTPPEPDPEPVSPSAAAKDAAIEDAVKTQVAKLIERASRVRAWGQAEDYARSRFDGGHLAYALAEIDKAFRASALGDQAAA
ncbi:MAG: phage recombination protein Bet [Chromatiaceae bacterium]